MFVYDRKTGEYKGRAGGPVRDVHTGEMQKMSSTPPGKGNGCFGLAVLLVVLGGGPIVAAVVHLLPYL